MDSLFNRVKRRLKGSSRSDTGEFVHEKLRQKAGSTRFLQVLHAQSDGVIRCRLAKGTVRETTFKALSYVWGLPTPTHRIFINEKPYDVRENLFQFLQKAQYDYVNVPLWIDALCIDQMNIRERNWQVCQMTAIYENASEVLIWLQDVLKHTEAWQYFKNDTEARNRAEQRRLVMCRLVDAQTNRDVYTGKPYADVDHWPGDIEMNGPVPDFVTPFRDLSTPIDLEHAAALVGDIGKHEYWKRMWVVQEFSLAKTASFVFKTEKIPVDALYGIWLALPMPLLENGYKEGFSERVSEVAETFQARQVTIARRLTGKCRLEMPDHLSMYGSRECADVRDRIFAIVGMSAQAETFTIDYSMTKIQIYLSLKVCLRFTSLVSSGGYLSLLEVTDAEATEYIASPTEHNRVFGAPFDGRVLGWSTSTWPRKPLLRICDCGRCAGLKHTICLSSQVLLVRLDYLNLWLIYCSNASSANNDLSFVALAASTDECPTEDANSDEDDADADAGSDGHGNDDSNDLFVYCPDSLLGLALSLSCLRVTQLQPLRIRLYASEKGHVAYAFLTKPGLTRLELDAVCAHRCGRFGQTSMPVEQPSSPFGHGSYFAWDRKLF